MRALIFKAEMVIFEVKFGILAILNVGLDKENKVCYRTRHRTKIRVF